jgi:serine/threonine protein kinase
VLAGPSQPLAVADLTPGTVVAGRYRMVALLGRGGMGAVYRADDLELDLPVALKFLPDAGPADEPRLDRFRDELRAGTSATRVSDATCWSVCWSAWHCASFRSDGR